MISWLLAGASIALIIWGDDFIKQAAQKGGSYFSIEVIYAFLLYGIGAPVWLYIMKHRSLPEIAVMYAALTVIGVTALGWLRYDEVPSGWQLAAIPTVIAAAVMIEL